MGGWPRRLNGHEFEQTPGDSEGQGSLAWCSSWGCRVRHDSEAEQQFTNKSESKNGTMTLFTAFSWSKAVLV